MGFDARHRVKSFAQALQILDGQGVKYDRSYRQILSSRFVFGEQRYEPGIHIYINLGDDRNVAWYTPITQTVAFYTDGESRPDGVPVHKRCDKGVYGKGL